jgi:hypothetical protein
LIAVLERGQTEGVLRKRDVRNQAAACWAQVHGLALLSLDGLLVPENAGRQPVENALLVLLEGLENNKHARPRASGRPEDEAKNVDAESDMERLLLDYIYEHEERRPTQTFLTQPLRDGQVVDYDWGQVLDQARRMASHLGSLGSERGARIAILSKNNAHFIMAELAIWMAGFTTVAIFPNENPKTISYILDHSDARLLFIGNSMTSSDKPPQSRRKSLASRCRWRR